MTEHLILHYRAWDLDQQGKRSDSPLFQALSAATARLGPMKKHDSGLWSFNTRDLMRSSGCQHCSQLAIARELDIPRSMLDSAGLGEVAVGTVDKFQGSEAMVVIVSLAASSALDAPRGLDFLLDRNRLNVALSRAKANCYLVHSPALTRSRFRDIEELKSVSRINGLLEQARLEA